MAKSKKKQTSIKYFFSRDLPKKPVEANVKEQVQSSLESSTLDLKEDIQPVTEHEEEEDPIVITRKRKRRIIVSEDSNSNSSSSSSSSDEEPLQKRQARLRQVEQCDDINDDIDDEELDFLDKSDILEVRTRGRQVSRYGEALKKIADRKSKLESFNGEKGPIEDYIISSESEKYGVTTSDESNSEDENFIVDDDIIDGEKKTDKGSEMAMVEMPAEFSSARAQSFSTHLSIYMEYLIELVLNPLYDISTNKRYQIAKNAVIRRVLSYKDSMVTSDVWTTAFKDVVDGNSNWDVTNKRIHDTAIKCEACRGNKPAKFQVILSSDNSSSSVTLNLGSECSRKGKLYHRFYHFQLHMYNEIEQVVNEMMSKYHLNEKNTIHEKLIESEFIKKQSILVKNSFSIVNQIYNLKSQRLCIADDTSSSDYTSYEES